MELYDINNEPAKLRIWFLPTPYKPLCSEEFLKSDWDWAPENLEATQFVSHILSRAHGR
jgi:hypothetical protein